MRWTMGASDPLPTADGSPSDVAFAAEIQGAVEQRAALKLARPSLYMPASLGLVFLRSRFSRSLFNPHNFLRFHIYRRVPQWCPAPAATTMLRTPSAVLGAPPHRPIPPVSSLVVILLARGDAYYLPECASKPHLHTAAHFFRFRIVKHTDDTNPHIAYYRFPYYS